MGNEMSTENKKNLINKFADELLFEPLETIAAYVTKIREAYGDEITNEVIATMFARAR